MGTLSLNDSAMEKVLDRVIHFASGSYAGTNNSYHRLVAFNSSYQVLAENHVYNLTGVNSGSSYLFPQLSVVSNPPRILIDMANDGGTPLAITNDTVGDLASIRFSGEVVANPTVDRTTLEFSVSTLPGADIQVDQTAVTIGQVVRLGPIYLQLPQTLVY